MSPSPLSKYVPSKDLAGFNSSVAAFLEKIESVESPQTEKITPDKAKSLHHYYMNNRANKGVDLTRSVFISSPLLFKTFIDRCKNGTNIDYQCFFDTLTNSSFYAYLGKYDQNTSRNPTHPTGQTTVIIQLAKTDGSIVNNEIYDFGSLCPPNCPKPEQISAPK